MSIELEIVAVPVDGLTLQGSLGLLDTSYDKFCADLDGPSAETNPVSDCGGKVVALPNGTYMVDRDHTDLELSHAPDTSIHLCA